MDRRSGSAQHNLRSDKIRVNASNCESATTVAVLGFLFSLIAAMGLERRHPTARSSRINRAPSEGAMIFITVNGKHYQLDRAGDTAALGHPR